MMRVLVNTLLIILAVSGGVSARLRIDPAAVHQQQQEQHRAARKLHTIDKQFIVHTSRNADINLLRSAVLGRNGNAFIKHEYNTAFHGFAVSGVTKDVIQALSDNNPGSILMIEEDYEIASETVWGIDRVDQRSLPLDNVYQTPNNLNGTGVDIYIIDTGIRSTHQQFNGRVKQESKDFSDDGEGDDGDDLNGHGTHVAGTAAGKRFGVAQGANLIAVRVLGSPDGSGTTSSVIAGIDWVAKRHSAGNGLSVANLSLGGIFSLSLNQAVENLASNGVVVVAAAGNSNLPACLSSPASALGVITVGATSIDDVIAEYSNYGICVDIFAPGTDIKSSYNAGNQATKTLSGTSMAAPHVAGAAALMLQADPSVTGIQAGRNLVNMATQDVIKGKIRLGSPNSLLYVGDIGNMAQMTNATAAAVVRPISLTSAVPQGHARIVMQVVFDNAPQETRIQLDSLYQGRYWTNVETWKGVQLSTNNSTDGDLQKNDANELIASRDLPEGYYAINVFDVYGDGMCCDNGNGTFVIKEFINEQEEKVIATGGDFRSYTSVEFSVVNGTVQLTTAAMVEERDD